jgi:selenocysteine-specific elongation factor
MLKTIEIPILKTQKKVKSIQVFRKPVEKAAQGDRCGICISNFDSKQFERGVICSPNFLKYSFGVIISLNKIKHFKGSIESGSKFHISIGHETLLGKVELFGEVESENEKNTNDNSFDFSKEYIYVHDLNPPAEENLKKKIKRHFALIDFNYENNNSKSSDHSATGGGVLCSLNSLLIGSKLDTDIHLNQCRIAFSGHVIHQFTNKDYRENDSKQNANVNNSQIYLSELKVYKEKVKEGFIERKHDEMTLIGKSLFKKETNMDLFVGLKVKLSTGEVGVIEGSFGQSGKFRIRIPSKILLCLI